MDRHYIDKRVSEELEGLKVNPPVEVWLGVSDVLDRRARQRRLPLLMGMAASFAAIMAVTLSLWLIQPFVGQTDWIADQRELPQALESLDAAPLILTNDINPPEARRVNIPVSDSAPLTENNLPERIPDPPLDLIARQTLVPASQNVLSFFDDLQPTQVAPALQPSAEGTLSFIFPGREAAAASGKFSLGVHVAPRQNHRLLARNSDFNNPGIPFESLEEGLMTHGVGMYLSYELSPGISVQTGLNYIATGQHVRDIVAYQHPGDLPVFEADRYTGSLSHPQSVITSQGDIHFHDPYHYFADVQSNRVITEKNSRGENDIKSLRKTHEGLTQVFHFLEIPLIFRYTLSEGLFGIHLKGGASGNFLLQNDVFAGKNLQQPAIGETYGIRQFNVSATGGLVFDVALTGRLKLYMEPAVQLFLNPIIQEGMMIGHAYPYSYSLQTGMSYDF